MSRVLHVCPEYIQGALPAKAGRLQQQVTVGGLFWEWFRRVSQHLQGMYALTSLIFTWIDLQCPLISDNRKNMFVCVNVRETVKETKRLNKFKNILQTGS